MVESTHCSVRSSSDPGGEDMTVLEEFIDCLEKGDNVRLADLFAEDGVLHDSSLLRIGPQVMHLEGKLAVEMMFHHKFGYNGGGYKIRSIRYGGKDYVWYFIFYGDKVVPVTAWIADTDGEGKIKRLNIYPL